MKVEIYQGNRGGWYWRMRARNGQIVMTGGEGYSRRWNCKRAVKKFCKDLYKEAR